MNTTSSITIGRVAILTAFIAIIGLVLITLFYALIEIGGGPFGTLNDICVALGGIISGILVWMLYPLHRSYAPRSSRFALASGLIGACLALIGLWLQGFNNSARTWQGFPRRLAQFGLIAAAVMAIGILAGPGILARTDEIDSAQWYVLAALFVGSLGWNILYTIWCLWFGRLLVSKKLQLPVAKTAE
jgi:hypothetical protein